MRRHLATTALTALVLASASSAALAEDGAKPKPIELSGFVDASIFFPIDGFAEDADGVTLGLDQVELDVTAQLLDGLKIQTDLNWFPASSVDSFDDIVEQGYVEVSFTSGIFAIAGKMNAPVGVEAVDPHEMYQFSHSLLFDFASPTNLTGFFLGWANDSFKVMAWVTNDWDMPSTMSNASVGGRVEYDFGTALVGLSSTFGPVDADEPRLMLDLDASVTLDALKLWLEGNFGKMDEAESMGVSVKGNYAFGDMSATLRFSYLASDFLPVDSLMEVTGAFLFTIAEGFGGIVEVRADIPDEGDTAIGAALEFTASY